jgi:cyanosortase A-associated protein
MTLFINQLRSQGLIPMAVVFVLLVTVHLLSLIQVQARLTDIFVWSVFYAVTGWFYSHNFPKNSLNLAIFPRVTGGLMVAFFCLRALTIYPNEFQLFWHLVLPVIFLGLALIINGWAGIKYFWRSLVGIAVISWFMPFLAHLGYRKGFLEQISAQLSAYFLWYLGFPSKSQGNYLFVNNGIVQIYSQCTAVYTIAIFLSLLLILTLYFPHLIKNLPLTAAIAITIAFLLSIVRIMIMAVVVNDKPLFDYWHGTTGGNIFISIGLLLFGGYLLWQTPTSSSLSISSYPAKDTKIPASSLSSTPRFTTLIVWSLAGILMTNLLMQQGSPKGFSNYEFPEAIALSGWTLIYTEALSPLIERQGITQAVEQNRTGDDNVLAIQQEQKGTDIFIGGHRYQYENSERSKRLTATFRYILNVAPGSDVTTYYQGQDADSEVIKALRTTKNTLSNSRGTILSFVSQDSSLYSACLLPNHQTQTQSYSQRVNEYDISQFLALKLKNVIPWLLGQNLLQDDRCLWIELKLSPLSQLESPKMDILWQHFYTYWTNHYPKS